MSMCYHTQLLCPIFTASKIITHSKLICHHVIQATVWVACTISKKHYRRKRENVVWQTPYLHVVQESGSYRPDLIFC